MGTGGRPAEGDNYRNEVLKRAPSEKPPFTLSDVKKAIPPHLFHRSLLHSFAYVFVYVFVSMVLYYVASTYLIPLTSGLSYVAWPVYWFLQGCVQVGWWLIGHDCSHQAFSDYPWLNDTVGLIIQSCILSPYFSFKYSHRRHHLNTASMERETSYVPKKKSELNSLAPLLNSQPGRLVRVVILSTIGWLLYICFNVAGQKYERLANHFDPRSPIYNDRERLGVVVTDFGLLAVGYGLYKLALAYGFKWLVLVYFGPLLITYGFVAVITWLQHTHPMLPHYDSTEWNWMKGALATVDRDYGKFLNTVFIHLPDAHVAHHLFVTIPHYNTVEATKAIKPVLGEYYQFDGTPILKAMWREATECFYVEADEGDDKSKGVYWFNNKL